MLIILVITQLFKFCEISRGLKYHCGIKFFNLNEIKKLFGPILICIDHSVFIISSKLQNQLNKRKREVKLTEVKLLLNV